MEQPVKSLIVRYTFILFATLLIKWWIFFFAPWDIPTHIPSTPMNIHGLAFIACIVAIFILFQRSVLKLLPGTSIWQLMLWSTVSFLLAEAIFQAVRVFTLADATGVEKVQFFVRGTVFTSLFAAAFAFLIAFQLKTKKTGQLLLLILAFLIIVYIINFLF
ncbi:hypothetical protein [Chitinophaga deserti]|uniref:hypothetical protein n=1 Tax=Chitinophaga deserti TaxID=2164099 RepID=UPI000D6B14E9|nr:hypothetical protein [Chitinophaga deserti]